MVVIIEFWSIFHPHYVWGYLFDEFYCLWHLLRSRVILHELVATFYIW